MEAKLMDGKEAKRPTNAMQSNPSEFGFWC